MRLTKARKVRERERRARRRAELRPATPVGSRLALEFAMSTGANFATPAALAAARRRVASPEPHEMLAVDRLWADLLSSMPLCFNLFGDLDGDRPGAVGAVRAWWPAAPAGVLRSDETYEARTIEDLIATPGTISVETRTAIVGRYL